MARFQSCPKSPVLMHPSSDTAAWALGMGSDSWSDLVAIMQAMADKHFIDKSDGSTMCGSHGNPVVVVQSGRTESLRKWGAGIQKCAPKELGVSADAIAAP